MLLSLLTYVGISHAEPIIGACGDSIQWSFDTQDSTLIVSGNAGIPFVGEGGPWRAISGIEQGSIAHLVIEEGITSIGEYSFYYCTNLKTIDLPQSLTAIYDYAFEHCSSLTEITIPTNIKILSQYAFDYCSSITSIAWNAKNYSITYNYTHGYGTFESRSPFYRIRSQITSFVFGEEVESLWEYCCRGMNKLITITIPEKVKSIGNESFRDCSSLKSVIFPDSLTSIGIDAFAGCSNIVSIRIPKSVRTFGEGAFMGCNNLKSVYIDDLKTWCSASFNGEDGGMSNPLSNSACLYLNNELVDTLVIPDSITSIGRYSFVNCTSIKTISLPTTLSFLGDMAFARCPFLDSVLYDAKDCNLQSGTPFYNAGVKSFVFGTNIEMIPKYICMSLTNLSSIIIPESVTYIGEMAFYGCSSISTITLPANLKKIEDEAFKRCTNLSVVYSRAKLPPVIMANTFYDISSTAQVFVPFGYAKEYKRTEYWSEMNIIVNKDYNAEIFPTSCNISVSTDGDIQSLGIEGDEQQSGNALEYNGLEPNSEYSNIPIVLMSNTGETETILISFTTPALTLTTQPSKAVSSTTAILLAETNISDTETGAGFEWKRNDAPTDMAGTKVYCPVANGTMAGRLKNLNDQVYYKYRAFYQSAAGNMYYGDWQYIFTGDNAVEFDPVLYTYAATAVKETEATLKGYALAGSDDFTEQGFEYWVESRVTGQSDNVQGTNAPRRMPQAAIGEHQTVQVSGISMKLTLTGLDAGTTYKYRTYAIVGGQTVYGSEMSFTTKGEYVPPTYTITFVDYDGTELLVLTDVAENTVPEYTGETPTRTEDEEYTYTFSGWQSQGGEVFNFAQTLPAATEDATYTATYEATKKVTSLGDIFTSSPAQAQKLLIDGTLYIILPDGTRYNATGAKIK